MTYSISKDFAFSASHQLNGLPADHQCSRLHGHNYIARVTFQTSQLDEVGFVIDYGELKPVKEYIDNFLDHQHLNDVFQFNTTAENMARHLAELIPELVEVAPLVTISVSLSETPKTWATYTSKPA